MNQDMIGRGGHGGGHGHHHGQHHGHRGGWRGGPWGYGYGYPFDYVVQVPCDPRLDQDCPWLLPDVYAAGVLPIGVGGAKGSRPHIAPGEVYGPPPLPLRRPLGRIPGAPPPGDMVIRLARSLVLAFEQGRTPAFQTILRRKLLATLQGE